MPNCLARDIYIRRFKLKDLVDSVYVENDRIIIQLKSSFVSNVNNSDEELASDDDWIKEHIKKYGKEPNLFDGV